MVVVALLIFSTGNVRALENIDTLDQLMIDIQKSGNTDSMIANERVKEFVEKRNERRSLLNTAKRQLKSAKSNNNELKKQFDSGESTLTKLQSVIHQRVGTLGELFGVVRQVAGETSALFEHSMTSSQVNNRLKTIRKIADSKALPSIAQLEILWSAMQREMIESGKIVKYTGNVVKPDGSLMKSMITRIGVFNASSEGRFLRYHSDTQNFYEVVEQPDEAYLSMLDDFEQSKNNVLPMVVDPSRGVMLDLYGLTPNLVERISQGKLVGYIIIGLGILGHLLLAERFFVLFRTENKLNNQLKSEIADISNPLGRILEIYKKNLSIDLATLERKIDEAIITEAPVIERGLSTIKILAVIAPLLGLLGTVTGMIETFQSITLFGTGDAKLMAGGISQALITTVLGLVVAIPLILLHSIVSNKSKRCINILEAQSAGLIASHAESNRGVL